MKIKSWLYNEKTIQIFILWSNKQIHIMNYEQGWQKIGTFLENMYSTFFVSLTMTLFSEKMLISNRCIRGFIPNSHKKSKTVSTLYSALYYE